MCDEPFHSIGGVSRWVSSSLLHPTEAHYVFPPDHPVFYIMNRYHNNTMSRNVGLEGEMQWHQRDIEYATFILGTIPDDVTIIDLFTTPTTEE